MNPNIKVQNLTRTFKQYKKKPGLLGSIISIFFREYSTKIAVNNINFEIKQGEIVGFIGPNGAGKTTTLKMLSGLIHPNEGEVQVLGFIPYERKKEFQKQFALVMGQKAQLWWDLPPMDSFLLNKEIYDVSDARFKEVVDELSELLEIKDILNIQVRKLSLGQRMKCELVASLIHTPKVIFLDEPTIGLDIITQKKIREFFKQYNKKYNATIILTSHYMDDVSEMCDRVLIINKGSLIFDGMISELTKEYADHKYLKLIFKEKIKPNQLESFGEIIEISDINATISVPRSTHTKVAGEILQKFEIDDLDIAEPDLEEIVTKIFDKNKISE